MSITLITLLFSALLSTSFALPDIREDNIFNPWLPGNDGDAGNPNPSPNLSTLKGKTGFGTCPVVTPVEDFNIDGILGTWYVHYHQEPSALTKKCGKWEVTRADGDVAEGIPCRIKIVRSNVDATTEQYKQLPTTTLFIDMDDDNNLHMTKSTPGRPPLNWYLEHTNYNSHLHIYGCEEFPGDDVPVKAFYQHNYLLRRDHNDIEPEVVDNLRRRYTKYGIDFDSFIKMDQQTCGEENVIIEEPQPNM